MSHHNLNMSLCFFRSGCEKDVQKVCSDSPEEHLQPFKDKMEAFSLKGGFSSFFCISVKEKIFCLFYVFIALSMSYLCHVCLYSYFIIIFMVLM